MGRNEQNIQASVLDRLIDNDPGVSNEPVQYGLLDIRQIRRSVIRDLENLLNSRRFILSIPSEFKEVNNSLLVYGLRDFTSFDPRNPSIKQRLRNEVKQTISRFEQRLKNVTVRIETQEGNERNIRFRITGMLVVGPIREPVAFDTFFDINRGEYVIAK